MNAHESQDKGLLSRFQQVRQRVARLCRDPAFHACLQSALAEPQLERFNAALARLEQNDIYIGSLGVQGVGKSTLVNALLFGRRILPVDVTETTAVLTKIYSANGDAERAEVVFSDGRAEESALSQESLRQYVHNEWNPGNEKRVHELRCFVQSRILSRGICLVDTPGVASLSEDVGKVTLDFLPQLSAALFITMTTPCLTATEVGFLRSAWGYCDRFFFVQNIWGESQENIEDATNDIRAKLSAIDAQAGPAFDPVIYRVDIHRAMEAMANDDDAEFQESGLSALLNDLDQYVNTGVVRIRLELFQASLQSAVDNALRGIDIRLSALDEESRQSEDEFREEEKKFKDSIREAENKWRQSERKFIDTVRAATRTADHEIRESLDNLSEQMVADIEARKMKAEHVSKSFDQRIRVSLRLPTETWERDIKAALEDVKTALSAEVASLKVEFEERFAPGSLLARLAGQGAADSETAEGLGEFMKWAGGLGVTVLASEAILAWFGLAAASSAAFGPAGWLVSVGLLVGGLILKKRCEKNAVSELREAVKKSIGATRKDVLDKLGSAESSLIYLAHELRQALDEEMSQILSELEQIRADRSRSEGERQQTREELRQCAIVLKKTESEVVEVIKSCLKN